MRDLLELANVAAGKAKIDTAIQERLNRFLAMATALQREWRVGDGVHVSQLKQRIRVASRAIEPDIRETLEQALGYIRKMTRPAR